MRTKKCTQCNEEKPLEIFYKQALTRHSMCNPCKSLYNKKQYWEKKARLKQSQW